MNTPGGQALRRRLDLVELRGRCASETAGLRWKIAHLLDEAGRSTSWGVANFLSRC